MDISFKGKRALVTGAGKGIGRAIAIALCKGGAETFALSRTRADLESLKGEQPQIQTLYVDLSDWDETRRAIQSIGQVNLLVNNAALGNRSLFMDVTPEEFQDVMDVNVKAVINVSQVVAKGMIENGQGGAIVNISSQASVSALREHTVYCASKSALDSITRVMALELGPHQIRVNCVNPTVVLTKMGSHWQEKPEGAQLLARIPLGKFADLKDVVHTVLFVLSDKADMITGGMIPVDGGFLAC